MRFGFTLLELLVVIGMISILVAVTLTAINPTKQLAASRDAKRRADVQTILNAIYQYTLDHQGVVPAAIPSLVPGEICVTGAATCVGGVDLDLLSGAYLVAIPLDPKASSTGTGTDYEVVRNADGRLSVIAPRAEGDDEIWAKR